MFLIYVKGIGLYASFYLFFHSSSIHQTERTPSLHFSFRLLRSYSKAGPAFSWSVPLWHGRLRGFQLLFYTWGHSDDPGPLAMTSLGHRPGRGPPRSWDRRPLRTLTHYFLCGCLSSCSTSAIPLLPGFHQVVSNFLTPIIQCA